MTQQSEVIRAVGRIEGKLEGIDEKFDILLTEIGKNRERIDVQEQRIAKVEKKQYGIALTLTTICTLGLNVLIEKIKSGSIF